MKDVSGKERTIMLLEKNIGNTIIILENRIIS